MKRSEEKKYESLSPFELKNKLIEMAETRHEKMLLNAGRGNPNWLAVEAREAFFRFGLFALTESEKNMIKTGFGGMATKKGISKRFEKYTSAHKKERGMAFLKKAYLYVKKELKISGDDFIFELVDGILGDHYPTPDRMLSVCEKIVHRYLEQEMWKNNKKIGKFHLFATEGGTAAMDYIFTSLMENKLLHKHDKIALGSPIFTPYLEIPKLNDYEFIELEVKQDENKLWQYSDKEIDKLKDPKVKAFFLVHPSNPTSVAMHPATLKKIANLVNTKRKDLILLTDDVYGTFVNDFQSLAAIAPKNTILVYSFSKYFGATGWRLGVIGLHEDNVFDKKIKNLPPAQRKKLYKRYESVTLDPNKMKLIDRMVADSRSVALNHTAGLSTPQQVLMTMFSLFCLVDKKNVYKKRAQNIIKERVKDLYKGVGIPHPDNKYDAHYYATIDIPALAEKRYSKEFSKYLIKNFEPIDFVMRLAEEKAVVLLDGGGFDAPNMSVRASLANLPDKNYLVIGKAIKQLLAEYYKEWCKNKK